MRTFLLASLLVLGACSKSEPAKRAPAQGPEESEQAKVPEITIDQLDAMLAANEGQAVDANGDGTRKKMGVIPGAVLLTDSETYSAAELPADKDKKLVFYCANTQCGASHEAAHKALATGHRNVTVLPDGIAGWVKAGKKVQTI